MSCHDVSSPNYNLIEVISSARDISLKIINIKEIHLKEGDVIYWNLIFSFSFWRNYWNLKLGVSMFDPTREHDTNPTRVFSG